MCPYIQNVLGCKIHLLIEEKVPTFLTIENHVYMQEDFWRNDHHSYVHEGVREIYMANYEDLQCMVGWRNGEPNTSKLGFKRDLAKSIQNTPKKPPLNEKYRITEWADDVLKDPVFPEMSQHGPTGKAGNKGAWGHQCLDWAKRASFVKGMGLHAAGREELIKVDGEILACLR
ncbi:hypothetical protein OQA88_7936 [Cercophora sp. LCS_1]